MKSSHELVSQESVVASGIVPPGRASASTAGQKSAANALGNTVATKTKTIAIVVPYFNTESTIPEVLAKARNYVNQIAVVDGYSSD